MKEMSEIRKCEITHKKEFSFRKRGNVVFFFFFFLSLSNELFCVCVWGCGRWTLNRVSGFDLNIMQIVLCLNYLNKKFRNNSFRFFSDLFNLKVKMAFEKNHEPNHFQVFNKSFLCGKHGLFPHCSIYV